MLFETAFNRKSPLPYNISNTKILSLSDSHNTRNPPKHLSLVTRSRSIHTSYTMSSPPFLPSLVCHASFFITLPAGTFPLTPYHGLSLSPPSPGLPSLPHILSTALSHGRSPVSFHTSTTSTPLTCTFLSQNSPILHAVCGLWTIRYQSESIRGEDKKRL